MKPELLIVTADSRGTPDREVVKPLLRAVEARGWDKRVVRQGEIRNSAGKPVRILEPDEARKLYTRAHSARLGVLATDDIYVQLNPSRSLLDRRFLATLERLVRYKAFFARVSVSNLDSVLDAYKQWAERRECDDERDPRVLPLQTFCPETDWNDLSLLAGRGRFNRAYGAAAHRVCEQELGWRSDPGRHAGREPQQVAGLELSVGCHWDVSSERRAGRLLTLTDVWQVPRGDHVNVYPNGHIRGGENSRMLDSVRSGSKRGRRSRKK